MQRPVLTLSVVLLGCFVVPANLNAGDAEDYLNRGIDSLKKGEHDKAIADFTEAIRLDPNCATAYSNRGDVWATKGENNKAIADYTEAIRLDPHFVIAYRRRGAAWGRKDEYDKAIADFNEAIRIDPKDATTFITRGYNWIRKSEFDKAIADFTEAIALDSKNADTHVKRGFAWQKKGDYDRVIDDLQQALSINPKCVVAYNGLAWLYATCPNEKYRDGKKAVENANKANQLTEGKVCAILDTLAAAYAENGDFDRAKQWATKAIEMAAADKSISEEDNAKLDSRLKLYSQAKPYREEPTNAEREGRASEDTRTWTAANGKYTVKATFVSSDATNVKLKKEDGTVITVALDRLNDEDRAWVQKRSKQ